jgi:hypothetical protein
MTVKSVTKRKWGVEERKISHKNGLHLKRRSVPFFLFNSIKEKLSNNETGDFHTFVQEIVSLTRIYHRSQKKRKE